MHEHATLTDAVRAAAAACPPGGHVLLSPACASFEEDRKGTVAPGRLADLAVFDTNLVEAARSDPRALLRAKVRYTIVGGRVVYEAGR